MCGEKNKIIILDITPLNLFLFFFYCRPTIGKHTNTRINSYVYNNNKNKKNPYG